MIRMAISSLKGSIHMIRKWSGHFSHFVRSNLCVYGNLCLRPEWRAENVLYFPFNIWLEPIVAAESLSN